MFFDNKILLFFIALIFFTTRASRAEYIRPVVYSPLAAMNSNFADTNGLSILNQINATLFRINEHGFPIPYLLESFRTSSRGKIYHFKLKDIKFHDGSRVTSADVEESLKSIIVNNVLGYTKLKIIKCFNRLLLNSKQNLCGFKHTGKYSFDIHLNKSNFRFPYYLSNQRLIITRRKDSRILRAGPYKVKEVKANYLVLEKFNDVFFNANSPTKIRFVKMGHLEAIKSFNAGKVSDLFNYTISNEKINNSKTYASYFPKTFAFFLNSRTINLKDRRILFKNLYNTDINNICFSKKDKIRSLIPFGMPGHSNKKIELTPHVESVKRTINIFVPLGLNIEKCVEKEINKIISSFLIKVSIVTFSEVIANWENGKIDAYFGYIEGEEDGNFFDHFSNKSEFSLGDFSNNKIDSLISRISENKSIATNEKIFKEISDEVNSRALSVPISYSGKLYHYNTQYEVPVYSNTNPALIPLNLIGLKK